MKTEKITNQTIFLIDWAKNDPRSVKAYLDGKGDGRVLWWKMNRLAHQLFRPKASLERIMFCFHSRHHALTLFSLKYWADVQKVTAVLQSHGVRAGIRAALASSSENTVI